MEIKTNAKFYKKKKMDSFYLAIASLVLIILISIGFYFYNYNLKKDIYTLNTQIDSKVEAIESLKKNKDVIIAKLYESNKSSINKLNDYSNVSIFIKHLYQLKRRYNINFTGFKYDSGKISTNVIANSDSIGINYEKTYKFISDYRKSKDALFNLDLVKSILLKNQGVSNVFNINLNLKNNFKEILENNKQKDEDKIIKKKQIEENVKKRLKQLKEKQKNKLNKE